MPILMTLAGLVLPTLAVARYADALNPWLVAAGAAVLSVLGFALIADDKRRARSGARRTPESTLHFVEALGGWPGSYLAQQRFRHKTVKGSYRLVFGLIVLVYQLVALEALLGWPLLRALGIPLGFL